MNLIPHDMVMVSITSTLGTIPMRREEESFAPTAEIALFIAGTFLTLMVIIFVAGLVVSIVREERAVAAERSAAEDEES